MGEGDLLETSAGVVLEVGRGADTGCVGAGGELAKVFSFGGARGGGLTKRSSRRRWQLGSRN